MKVMYNNRIPNVSVGIHKFLKSESCFLSFFANPTSKIINFQNEFFCYLFLFFFQDVNVHDFKFAS